MGSMMGFSLYKMRSNKHPFIHLVVCLTTGPKQALHIVWSKASSFKWEYPFLSLRSSNSFLRLLPCLPVTSIPPCIFPSITCCRRQFLRKMWPIQFAFCLLISCRIFLCSLTVSNISSFLTWSVQLIFSILLQHHISKLSRCFWSTARSVQVSAPYKAMLQTSIYHENNLVYLPHAKNVRNFWKVSTVLVNKTEDRWMKFTGTDTKLLRIYNFSQIHLFIVVKLCI